MYEVMIDTSGRRLATGVLKDRRLVFIAKVTGFVRVNVTGLRGKRGPVNRGVEELIV
jgi:hypothetical protein